MAASKQDESKKKVTKKSTTKKTKATKSKAKTAKKTSVKKTTTKKSTTKKTSTKKTVSKKTTAKKSSAKKNVSTMKNFEDTKNLSTEEIIEQAFKESGPVTIKKTESGDSDNKKGGAFKFILLILIVALAVGVYYFFRRKQVSNRPVKTPVEKTEQPIETPVADDTTKDEKKATEDLEPKKETVEAPKKEVEPEEEKKVVEEKPVTKKDSKAKEIEDIKVYFAKGSGWISHRQKPKMIKIARYLKANPESKLLITGYTCDLGRKNVNNGLAMYRAKNALKYLKSKGISASRIKIKGIGHSPKNQGGESSRRKSRKLDFTII